MTKEELLEKQGAATKRFNELEQTKKDAEDEQKRLQGEFRVYQQMIDDIDNKEIKNVPGDLPEVKVKDEAKDKK